MKVRHYVLIVMLFIVAIFITANWPLVSAPSNLNLLLQNVDAPLGIVLCGVIILQSIIFLVFLAKIETSAALESHSRNKEIEKLRKLADSKEASRLHDLEERIESRFEELFQVLDQIVREESLEDLRAAIDDEGTDFDRKKNKDK